MKAFLLIVLLLAGGAAFYFYGGAEKFGWAEPKDLPDTITPPNATFIGDEYTNPYAQEPELTQPIR